MQRYVALAMVLILPLTGLFAARAESTEPGAAALDDVQRNSIAMLNYLAVLTQEINTSRNSRLFLEDAYSSLINNTSPDAVDEATRQQLTGILDTLYNYRMTDVKRARIEQERESILARSIQAAIPENKRMKQLSNASAGNDPFMFVSTLAIIVAQSVSSYDAAASESELEYLRDGWALEDDEAAALHESRKGMFNYMLTIVNENHLPGELALSERAVEEFVEWKHNGNAYQRIRFLESNRETYQALGDYWLTLAASYSEIGDYPKCLDAVASYEALDVRIFRRDHDFAAVLPLAIAAAGQLYEGEEYARLAEHFAAKIVANTGSEDWALRYCAANVYAALYAQTGERRFLRCAYDVTLDNVNTMVNFQRDMNANYLAEIEEVKVPDGATRAQKKEIKNYNKQLKKDRKLELPPVYDPLTLNCDLLFALAQELDIPEAERQAIDGILHGNGEPLFLVPSIDALYYFDAPEGTGAFTLEFTGDELTLPAMLVTDDAQIDVYVLEPDSEQLLLNDWELKSVEREDDEPLESWVAHYKSPTARKHDYADTAKIMISITPRAGLAVEPLQFSLAAFNSKDHFWEKVMIWDDGIRFE